MFCDHDDDIIEPPVSSGLAKLSAPLQALAEFLHLDENLVAGAAAGGNGEAPAEPSKAEQAKWIKKLLVADKDDYLIRLLEGESNTLLRADLARRFRDATKPKGGPSISTNKRRTIAELFDIRDRLEAEKKRKADEKATREKAAHDGKKVEERAVHLEKLALREAEAWREVDTLIATKLPANYDLAVELLVGLRAIAGRSGRLPEVQHRIEALRELHRRKPTLMERFAERKLGSSVEFR